MRPAAVNGCRLSRILSVRSPNRLLANLSCGVAIVCRITESVLTPIILHDPVRLALAHLRCLWRLCSSSASTRRLNGTNGSPFCFAHQHLREALDLRPHPRGRVEIVGDFNVCLADDDKHGGNLDRVGSPELSLPRRGHFGGAAHNIPPPGLCNVIDSVSQALSFGGVCARLSRPTTRSARLYAPCSSAIASCRLRRLVALAQAQARRRQYTQEGRRQGSARSQRHALLGLAGAGARVGSGLSGLKSMDSTPLLAGCRPGGWCQWLPCE